MATEVEVLVNAEGRVGICIDALSAAPVSYKLLDHENMILELVCDDGTRHRLAFAENARDGWQKVVDNEELLVTEVNADNLPEGDDLAISDIAGRIVRDEWLKPEIVT